jgi:hypothetical protein
MVLCAPFATALGTPLVENGEPRAVVVLPEHAAPISLYAAQELAYHVEKASGARLDILTEPIGESLTKPAIYIGATAAATRDAGIDPNTLASEDAVLRTHNGNLYIVGNDGPKDALNFGNTHSGTLWGVYEVLERWLGVRWLWPGDLGEYVPEAKSIVLPHLNKTVAPHFVTRNLRPGLGRRGFAEGHERMSFSPEHAKRYAHDQTVFLRRHRMGRSAGSHRSQRRFGSGHSFNGWWERYGATHPEWFQMLPDGKRGPADANRPHRISMCVSNPELHANIIALWQKERYEYPKETINIDLSENDGSASCVCVNCLAWDAPESNPEMLPPGLERSFEPVQAGTRYARFAMAVHRLASAIDPDVKVTYYAYLNYFWAPSPPLEMHPNIVIEFVPWFRWAGWFPRADSEQAWIKEQWLGWQRSGVSAHYRPNWFLDGYTMPLAFMHQFAEAFQFYARNGMIGTDFDSLQGQWATQGPNLYLLSRLHVRPETLVDTLLEEYYAAFGPASENIKAYFSYWEDYAIENSQRAAETIRSRRDGHYRRYANYAQVVDELYPLAVFPPAETMLESALNTAKAGNNPIHTARIIFLQQGLAHAKQCVSTAGVVNSATASMSEKKSAIADLATLRRSLEHTNIANMDRAAIIEADSWEDIPGLFEP